MSHYITNANDPYRFRNAASNQPTTPNVIYGGHIKPGKIVAPKPPVPARAHCEIPKLLQFILKTKRPTKNPQFNEDWMCSLLKFFKIDHEVDNHHNITVEVGSTTTCFTSHTDTVHNSAGESKLLIKDGYVSVDGGGVLGADDGTGIYIMLEMIRANVPGLYVFFSEEEKGRVGSIAYKMPAYIQRCVSFDRKNINHLITTQSGEKGCSDEFAEAFIKAFPLPFVKDPTGSYTDSYSFFDIVPECINLSVGYYWQHTQDEIQDIKFAIDMAKACIQMDWDSLPTKRDPEAEMRRYYAGHGYTGRWWDDYGLDEEDDKAVSVVEPIYKDVYEFCYDYPDIVADVLEAYGITLADLIKYKNDEYETVTNQSVY